MDFTSLLVQLVAGAVGGNAAGAAAKETSLGPIGNTIAGGVGGLGGGALLPIILPMLEQQLGPMLNNALGAGVGGIVLTLIVGFIKSKMAK